MSTPSTVLGFLCGLLIGAGVCGGISREVALKEAAHCLEAETLEAARFCSLGTKRSFR